MSMRFVLVLIGGLAFSLLLYGGMLVILTITPNEAAGYSALITCALVVLLGLLRLWKAINVVPTCQNGCCRLPDYECLGRAAVIGLREDGTVWLCKCGIRYLDTNNGKFFRVGDDGALIIYKVKGFPVGRWRNARSQPASPILPSG